MKDTEKLWKKFVVLEGLDGAGTTTQKDALVSALKESKFTVSGTCEPTAMPTGLFLRRCLKNEEHVDPGTLAYLFSADRYEHLHHQGDGIATCLDRGDIVICDRYLFSSLAYQSLALPFNHIAALNAFFPLPEFLFFLEVPAETALSRIRSRGNREIFESSAVLKQVEKGYQQVLDHYAQSGMEIVIIDGTLPKEAITGIILEKLQPILR